MKHFLLIVSILIISTTAFAQGTEEPWQLSWPFFENTSGPSGVLNGYGDWCVIDEGPHPGLDFAAVDTIVKVLVPTGSDMVSLGARDYQMNDEGCAMVIGPSIVGDPPYWGWGLLHLDIQDPKIWPFVHGSSLTGWQPLAPCYQYDWQGGVPAPLHLHLGWIDCIEVSYPPYVVPNVGPFEGYYNPFEYFEEDDLSTYDEIQFKKALYEGFHNTGAWFMPDDTETAGQISGAPGNPDYQVFQNIVSGAIDIAVAPFSAFQGLSERDSAGVYSVSYEILQQDPITLDYLPAASGTDNYGERFLMQMRDEALPYGDSPEYRAIFLDGNLISGATEDFCNPGENSYIVTNSGALDPSSWTTGWDNVWIDPYLNDWTTGICQGAWVTNLQLPPDTGDAQTNADAFFPDGRYAVRVTAVSHGSRDTDSLRLPVDDLSLPDPQVEGIIVDNFLPHIVRVAAYAWDPAADTCRKIYAGYWEDIDTDRARESESDYLEQLRTELHALQSSNQVDVLPSRSVSSLPESFSQSSLEHDYQAERNRLSRENSTGTGNFISGSCMDEGIGLDTIDQLMRLLELSV